MYLLLRYVQSYLIIYHIKYSFFTTGPPRILNTEAIFYGRVGSNVELSCDAFAVPPPASIQWSNYGFSVPINQASEHFR